MMCGVVEVECVGGVYVEMDFVVEVGFECWLVGL